VLGGFDELREFFWTRANSVRSASFPLATRRVAPRNVDQCLYHRAGSGGQGSKLLASDRRHGDVVAHFAALRQDQFNTLRGL